MGFLTGLLPGLRELRAPLAAGYLWIAFIFLLFRQPLMAEPPAGSVWSDVFDIGKALGVSYVLIGVTFVAYIVGILSTTLTDVALHWISRKHRRPPEQKALLGDVSTPLSTQGVWAVVNVVEDNMVPLLADGNQARTRALNRYPEAKALIMALGSDLELDYRRRILSSAVAMEDHVQAIVQDIEILPLRLVDSKTELYSTYDRLIAEGEFRAAITVPIAAVGCALGTSIGGLSGWITLAGGLLLAIALLVQARSRVTTAADQLAIAIRAGKGVDSPPVAVLRDSPIQFHRTALSSAETARIREKATAAENARQTGRAHELFAILAATGSVEANEKRCGLSRLRYGHYGDGYKLIEPELIEGAEFSGRLALEAVESLIKNTQENAEWPERRKSATYCLLQALRHDSSRTLAWDVLHRLYEVGGWTKQMDAIATQLERVSTNLVSPFVFLAEYAEPDIARDTFQSGYYGVVRAHDSVTLSPPGDVEGETSRHRTSAD